MKSFLKKSALRSASCLQVLSLTGLAVGAIAISAPAAAQDYTSAAIGGTVTDESGNAVTGATVTLTSSDTNVSRSATTSASGAYRFTGLLPGNYDLRVEAANLTPYTAQGIKVLASQAATVPVQLAAGGGQEIVVLGSRAVQAFAGTTTGLNVDVSDFIKDKPLGRSLSSIILLTPGVVPGNSTNTDFNGLTSLGGASVAENAYYVNGLNTTNFDNYLGSAQVPFYFYKSVDTKTGGYPAEYGRATGGIVNAVTKSGSNEYMAAVHVDWAPDFLRANGHDVHTAQYIDSNDPSLGTESVLITDRKHDRADSLLTAFEVSGPIIPDRLFIYGLLQLQNVTSRTNAPNSGFSYRRTNTDPFWGVKVDAYPIDSQHLEFTIFDTRNATTRYDDTYTLTADGPVYGSASAVTDFPGGGLNFVGKYTGTFTDWLTVSAAYGRVRDRFDQVSTAGAGGTPYFSNASGGTIDGVNNGGLFTGQALSSIDAPYSTERKFYRGDVDLNFSLVGEHHIRAGYDREENTLKHVTVRTGGAFELANGYLSQEAYDALLGGAGYAFIAQAPDAIGNIVELNYYNTGGAFKATNQAYYIEDEWKPFDRLTLNLGVRRDDFRVNKPSGLPLADLTKNYAPRLGATFQVDPTSKVYASYGWYYLPVASNTAYRQGAPSDYFRQRYHFSGINSDGLPILGSLVTDQGNYQTACPFALLPGGAATNCNVTGDGADIDLSQGIASNLKATREDEFIIGYEKKLDLWTFGINYTRRQLKRTAEDSAVDAAVIAYCDANGIVPVADPGFAPKTCAQIWTGFHQYVINNPGSDITVNLLANGYDINNQTVTLTAADLGYGKAKRTYDAVTLTFDRAYDGLFSVGGSYTWSKDRGNSEGYVQSDFGQDDSGITQDFDQPGFVDYSYGDLPNDRRHKLKLYGSITPLDGLTFGTNFTLISPAPLSCFGFHPTDAFANGYDAASHYCDLKPSQRGTAQKSAWMNQLDLSGRYTMEVEGLGITFRADVFNVFNSRAVLSKNQFGDLDAVYGANGLPSSVIHDPSYGIPNLYQSPRYVRLGMDITFGGHREPPPPPVAAPLPAPVEEAAPPPPPPVEQAPPPPPVVAPSGERG